MLNNPASAPPEIKYVMLAPGDVEVAITVYTVDCDETFSGVVAASPDEKVSAKDKLDRSTILSAN